MVDKASDRKEMGYWKLITGDQLSRYAKTGIQASAGEVRRAA
jgi:hypothetical protein